MEVDNTTHALMLQGPFQWLFSSTHTHLCSNAFSEEDPQVDLES
jgi:hypothetical protein